MQPMDALDAEGQPIFPVGKYRGQRIGDVYRRNSRYVRWIFSRGWFSERYPDSAYYTRRLLEFVATQEANRTIEARQRAIQTAIEINPGPTIVAFPVERTRRRVTSSTGGNAA
jgi:hypothetical protein